MGGGCKRVNELNGSKGRVEIFFVKIMKPVKVLLFKSKTVLRNLSWVINYKN